MTRFIVVRHGETRWNLEARIQGHGDSPLTDLGRVQAEAVARRLERNFGSVEGLGYAELHERFPGAYSRHLQDTDPDFRVPEAETRREFYARIGASFEALAREEPGRRLAVVCHGGVLAALYRHVHRIPAAEIHSISIPNAAYNCVARDAAGWTIEAWADVAHLAEADGSNGAARGSILARMS